MGNGDDDGEVRRRGGRSVHVHTPVCADRGPTGSSAAGCVHVLECGAGGDEGGALRRKWQTGAASGQITQTPVPPRPKKNSVSAQLKHSGAL